MQVLLLVVEDVAGASAVLLTDLDRDVAFTRAAVAEGAPTGGGTDGVGGWEQGELPRYGARSSWKTAMTSSRISRTTAGPRP